MIPLLPPIEKLMPDVRSLEVGIKTKLNTRLEIRQKADLFEVNISANKITLPQCQSYTEREYYYGS